MNTASRMESTGQKNRIQISKATADLLKKEDKEHWYVEREGGVEAKGKGQLHTFWLSPASMSAGTGTRSSGSGTGSYTSNNNNNNARQRRSSTASRRDYTDNTGSKSGSGSFEFDEEIGSHHSMSFHMSQTETESNV